MYITNANSAQCTSLLYMTNLHYKTTSFTCICKTVKNIDTIVIPKYMALKIIVNSHNFQGHTGTTKTSPFIKIIKRDSHGKT